MGGTFTLPSKTCLLDFASTEYDGAEVRCRMDVTLGTLLAFQRMQGEKDVAEMVDRFTRDVLLEWNLTDQVGGAVPCDLAAVPLDFAMRVIEVWVGAVANPPTPLAAESANGGTSREQ